MKRALRREFLRKRRRLPENEWNARSRCVQDRFLHLPEYRHARCILTYAHFDREVRTDDIIRKALRDGKIVCIPFTDWERRMITPGRILDPGEIRTVRIVPEPVPFRPVSPDIIDLVIVPGVVFDVEGNRIGMGGGYFDRFLPSLRKDACRLSLVFDFQIRRTRLPADLHDIPVQLVLTETRHLRTTAVGGASQSCSGSAG